MRKSDAYGSGRIPVVMIEQLCQARPASNLCAGTRGERSHFRVAATATYMLTVG